ncbi:2-polyprenyl-3-methyl-5-hydroxy-6-metoxy-1,4-benzoquinol methylase [Sphingomonas zeicaulis]|uniref:methyltransferase domain-containing protein n=1 Tax=Sphingomonas zeicaulis TaxID=1632740 RepID=UPI003D249F32
MNGLAVRTIAEEQMDAPDLDPAVYAAVLTDLGKVNRVVMTARPTLAFLARATRGLRRFSLLDVGFGDGGMLRTIARWASKRGIEAELHGVDLNTNSVAVAQAASAGYAIDYHAGDYADRPDADFIISSLVAHHMTHDQLVAFVAHMERHATLGWFVNDLLRSNFAYRGYPLLARLMRWHPIVRADGQLSIARSYRPEEWPPMLAEAGVAPGTARILKPFPFRLCVERLH